MAVAVAEHPGDLARRRSASGGAQIGERLEHPGVGDVEDVTLPVTTTTIQTSDDQRR